MSHLMRFLFCSSNAANATVHVQVFFQDPQFLLGPFLQRRLSLADSWGGCTTPLPGGGGLTLVLNKWS
jgi:hypothetical protein